MFFFFTIGGEWIRPWKLGMILTGQFDSTGLSRQDKGVWELSVLLSTMVSLEAECGKEKGYTNYL